MLSQKLQDAINIQISHEMNASYLYLSMAAYCDSLNLSGFANWLRVQSEEERMHAMKFFDFLHDRDGRVFLQSIAQPPAEFETVMDVFEQTLEHERKVTSWINELYALAVAEQDYPTQVLLQWFINEQVEEEKNATLILEQLNLVGAEGVGLFMIDRELAGRSLQGDPQSASEA
ncbi:MAG: ferritin [Chloroflexales bacterium]|nr:ferritin [Chloroflexales bacterium]